MYLAPIINLVSRPISSISVLHIDTKNLGMGPGDEAKCTNDC